MKLTVHFFKMAGLFSVEDVLASVLNDSSEGFEEEESDFEGEGIYSYKPGGFSQVEVMDGALHTHDEEDHFSDDEEADQPAPPGFRGQANGE